ncbi:MAG: DUF5625 family protein [Pseudomonadota bacterium]
MKNIFKFTIIILLAFITASCNQTQLNEMKSGVLQQPFKIPFDIKKTGIVNKIKFQIMQRDRYAVDIQFALSPVQKKVGFFSSHKVTPQEQKDATRLFEILGGIPGTPRKLVQDNGVPATIRVQFIRQSDQKVLLNQVVDRPRTWPGGGGRNAPLTEIVLDPGFYAIKWEILQIAPELAPLYTQIFFVNDYHGK